MNMASIGIFIFTVIFISAGSAEGAVKVQCKNEIVALYGRQSLVECVVETSQDTADTNIEAVTWRKDGVQEPLLFFHNGSTRMLPGYSFAEPSWNKRNMDVSLLITNTTEMDEGVYTCEVMTDSGSGSSNTTLIVIDRNYDYGRIVYCYFGPSFDTGPTKMGIFTITMTCIILTLMIILLIRLWVKQRTNSRKTTKVSSDIMTKNGPYSPAAGQSIKDKFLNA